MAKAPNKPLGFKAWQKSNPKGKLKGYKRYLKGFRQQGRQANQRAQRAAQQQSQGFDALAALGPDEIKAQILDQVNMIMGGADQSVMSSFNAAASSGAGQIRGFARDAANQLRGLGPAAGAAYQRAQAEQKATDASMMSNLSSMGADVAAQVGRELGIAGQPQQAALELGNMAGASSATVGGFGSAALSQLISQGAAAQGWLSGLPAAALAQGNSDAASLTSQIMSQRASAMADMAGQRSSLMADLLTQANEREYQKAVTRLGFQGDMAKLSAQGRDAKADRKWKAQQARLDRLEKAAERRARRALEEFKQSQSNARNDADNATSRQNTRDRIAASGKTGGGDTVNDRREKALKEASAIAKRLHDMTSTRSVPLHENPATPGAVTGYDEQTTYPFRNTGQGKGAVQAYQRVLARLRMMLPNAPPMVLHNLANMAMANAGYQYQAPRPTPRGAAVGPNANPRGYM